MNETTLTGNDEETQEVLLLLVREELHRGAVGFCSVPLRPEPQSSTGLLQTCRDTDRR